MSPPPLAHRVATCLCGQLAVTCRGEPVRVSVCHCLNCQKRSGSAFAVQARWAHADVTITGTCRDYVRPGESGSACTFRFCPDCGGMVCYVSEGLPGLTAVPVGCFADPGFPAPHYSVFEERKHSWVEVTGEGIEHFE